MTDPDATPTAASPATPTATEVLVVDPPRRKRRGRVTGIVVAAVLLLLGFIAFLVGDGIARETARDYVRARVIEVLGLEQDARVDVEFGSGSILLQALVGRIETVDVHVPVVTFGVLSGAAEVHAEDVPLDATQPVGVLRIEFSVDEADLGPLAANLSGIELEDISLEEPAIVVTTGFNVFGLNLPVGMEIEPSAVDGELVFTPTTVQLGDETIEAQDLLDDPLFGGLARSFLQQQSLCVAEFLPVALTVTDAAVDGDRLVIGVSGDGAALGGEGLTTSGSCASSATSR